MARGVFANLNITVFLRRIEEVLAGSPIFLRTSPEYTRSLPPRCPNRKLQLATHKFESRSTAALGCANSPSRFKGFGFAFPMTAMSRDRGDCRRSEGKCQGTPACAALAGITRNC
jgi:hypothetical protein